MLSSRCLSSASVASVVMLVATVSAAPQTPPVPSKVLPPAQGPAAGTPQSFVSPITGTVYTFQTIPETFETDEAEKALGREAESPAAPGVAPAPPAAAAAGIPKSEFYHNGSPV